MKMPDKCPVCTENLSLIHRTELDWDSDEPDRVEDSIGECSNCHTLFRLRWKLASFRQLVEIKEKEVSV